MFPILIIYINCKIFCYALRKDDPISRLILIEGNTTGVIFYDDFFCISIRKFRETVIRQGSNTAQSSGLYCERKS